MMLDPGRFVRAEPIEDAQTPSVIPGQVPVEDWLMVPDAISEVGDLPDLSMKRFVVYIRRQMRKGNAELPAPDSRVIPFLQHSDPEAKRQTRYYLPCGNCLTLAQQAALHHLDIVQPTLFDSRCECRALPPVGTERSGQAITGAISKADLYRLDWNVERLAYPRIP